MCGICGILSLRGETPDQQVLEQMVATLRHRGPDDSGRVISGPCGLGNTRLAIIDLTEAGHQPMRVVHTVTNVPSRTGELFPPSEAWITYNGEAYNFGEIKAVLSAMRHRFFSQTDTETLLRAYIQFDVPNFIKAFRGMFAMAIWDVSRQRLLLVRDRLGQKPLYYALADGWFVFGSEIKTLLAHPSIPRRLNEEAVPYYLAYGYPPEAETLFEGIFSLPPGYMLQLDLQAQHIEPVLFPYWHPPYPTSNPDPRTEENIAADLLAHLRWSVRMQMIADVPVGAFLSGGLDSAAVVALMAQETSHQIKTFSIGFKDIPSFDETRFARMVQAHFVTEHHEFMVEPNVIEMLDDLVWYYDQPFGDSSAIPTYLVSRLARDYVTVVLTGDGGDELFAGYERFRAARLATTYSLVPEAAHRAIGGVLERLPESTGYSDVVRNTSRFVRAARLPLAEQYLSWVRYTSADWIMALMGHSHEEKIREHYGSLFMAPPQEEQKLDVVSQLLDVNIRTYLSGDLLVKVDRMSMASSLEARSPFLDHQLLQFAANIPSSLKLKRGSSKYILKRALRGILPDRIIERRKHGFGVPVGTWFREQLAGYARDVLLNKQSMHRNIFSHPAVEAMLQVHQSGKADLGNALWSLLTFELWMRRYFG